MSFSEEQVRARLEGDDAKFQHAMESLAAGVSGIKGISSASRMQQAQDAVGKVIAYYGAKPVATNKEYDSVEELLEHSLDSTGIMYREVRLTKGWYKDAVGCFLGMHEDGTPVALLPRTEGGYSIYDPTTGKTSHVNDHTVGGVISEYAFCFYRPLPNTRLNIRGIIQYMLRSLDKHDYVVTVLAALMASLMGMLLPILNKFAFGPVLNAGDVNIAVAVGVMMLSVTLAQLLINTVRSVVLARVDTKLRVTIQAALMMRILNLPASFFHGKSAGQVAASYNSMNSVVSQLEQQVFGASLTGLFSFFYILQLMAYAPIMVVPAMGTIIAAFVANQFIARSMSARTAKILKNTAKRTGFENSIIMGIQKIKLAGAEKRVFSKWGESYAKSARFVYGNPGIAAISAPVTTFISIVGYIVIYFFALNGGVQDVASYMAFSSAYGLVSAAFSALNASLTGVFTIKPHLKMVEPFLKEVPESNESKRRVTELRGGVELRGVGFSYGSTPLFKDLNISVKPGEYVGVVGKTGCGKSTLIRLMLGFETPNAGVILYDGRDLATLDANSLRRNIGVVLQKDNLMQGSIYHNIAIANPGLTFEEVWEAAEMASIAEDIRSMPMGMQTLVSSAGGGFSGGQKQRIMIARAIAGKPNLLIFDEATSALDNITQRQVAESLDTLDCTRIVIAHRLSMVQRCDRILVLDEGKIVEEGNYEQLMALDGVFAELVRRQIA